MNAANICFLFFLYLFVFEKAIALELSSFTKNAISRNLEECTYAVSDSELGILFIEYSAMNENLKICENEICIQTIWEELISQYDTNHNLILESDELQNLLSLNGIEQIHSYVIKDMGRISFQDALDEDFISFFINSLLESFMKECENRSINCQFKKTNRQTESYNKFINPEDFQD